MTTPLEDQLRQALATATPPAGLIFDPDAALRRGRRTVRNRRLATAGSLALVVATVAVGSTALTHRDTSATIPADRSSTSPTRSTGTARGQMGTRYGSYEVDLDRDASHSPNLRYSFTANSGKTVSFGGSWTDGTRPVAATWDAGTTPDGRHVIVGVLPAGARNTEFVSGGRCRGGAGWMSGVALQGTAYQAFGMDCAQKDNTVTLEGLWWTGQDGRIAGAGFEGASVHGLALSSPRRPGAAEVVVAQHPSGVSELLVRFVGATPDTHSSSATSVVRHALTDGAGHLVAMRSLVAVSTGNGTVNILNDGPPVVVGVLPSGARDISVEVKGSIRYTADPRVEHLPGTDFDAVAVRLVPREGDRLRPSQVTSVSWVNADGTTGQQRF